MSASTRTITIKFASDVKGVVVGAAVVDKALGQVSGSKNTSGLSKITSGLNKLSEGMANLGQKATRIGAPLVAFEKGLTLVGKAAPQIAQASGALGLLPGAIAVAGAAMAVLKLGAKGISEAFKGVGTETKNSLVKVFDTQLTPAAGRLRKTLGALTPALDGVARSEAGVISSMIRVASTGTNVRRLNTILDSTHTFVGNIGAALTPLEDAFIAIASVAAPLFVRLTSTLGDFAAHFDRYIQRIAKNGQLQAWIQRGIDKLFAFGDKIRTFFTEIAPIIRNLAGIKLTLFSAFTPAIIPALTAVTAFLKANPNLAAWILGVGIALRILAPLISGVGVALDVLSANPIILIIAAVALLVAGFVVLYNKSATFRAFFQGLWHDVLAAAQPVIAWFQTSVVPTFKKIWDDVQILLGLFAEAWSAFWNSSLGGVAKAALGVLWGIVQLDWSLIKGVFLGAMTIIVGALKGAWTIIKAVFSGAFQIIEGLLNIFIGIFTGNWSRAWKGIKEVLSGAWTIIWGIIKGIGQAIGGVFSGIARAAGSVASTLGGIFAGIGRSILGGLKGALNVAIGLINGLINGVNAITGAVGIPSIPNIPHLAKGGTARRGQPYLVGENGPELFTPGQTGRVTDAAQTAAMGGDSEIHVYIGDEELTGLVTRVVRKNNRQLKTKVLSGGSR